MDNEAKTAAIAFLEAWERENELHNSTATDAETYFKAAVKTAECALTFRLALTYPATAATDTKGGA